MRNILFQTAIIKRIMCLNFKSKMFLVKEMLMPLAQNFSCNIDSLEAEIKIFLNLILTHKKTTGVETGSTCIA